MKNVLIITIIALTTAFAFGMRSATGQLPTNGERPSEVAGAGDVGAVIIGPERLITFDQLA